MKTIIVGIDGSHAAITAALWGVDEAISRAVPLRLVSVIKPTHPSGSRSRVRLPAWRCRRHSVRWPSRSPACGPRPS